MNSTRPDLGRVVMPLVKLLRDAEGAAMKRSREKAKRWNARWLKKSSELLPVEIDMRIEMAYVDGFEAGQRHQRKVRRAPR